VVCDPCGSINARRVECSFEAWVECGRACEEFMVGEDEM